MEDTKKGFNLLKFVNDLKPKIIELNWASTYGLQMFEFEVSLDFNQLNGVGRGCSQISKEHAIEIAATEAIERVISRLLKFKNTNGLSGHNDFNTSKNNSIAEVIERHVFLKNYYSDCFVGEELDLHFADIWLRSAKELSRLDSFNLLIGKVLHRDQIFSVVINVTHLKKSDECDGYVLGLGCSTDLNKSISSAEIESLRFVAHIIDSKVTPIDLESFLLLECPSFEDHMLLALEPKFSSKIQSKFRFVKGEIDFQANDINLLSIRTPTELSNFGLVFTKASSPSLLDLFVGIPDSFFKNCFKLNYPQLYNEDNFLIPHALG